MSGIGPVRTTRKRELQIKAHSALSIREIEIQHRLLNVAEQMKSKPTPEEIAWERAKYFIGGPSLLHSNGPWNGNASRGETFIKLEAVNVKPEPDYDMGYGYEM